MLKVPRTIMPTASHPNPSQADVDALSQGLDRWARYPVSPQRAQELATEFAQLNAAVQAGAAHLRLDDEPSAYAAWLQSGPTGG